MEIRRYTYIGPLVTLGEIGKSVMKSLLLQIHQSNRNV
jgi:hypothetical protein